MVIYQLHWCVQGYQVYRDNCDTPVNEEAGVLRVEKQFTGLLCCCCIRNNTIVG